MSVIAYHLIWTNYGTWLGNDPRGSGSQTVYTPVLAELGEVHFGRKKLQPVRSKVREFYKSAEPRLKFDVIRFDEQKRSQIANSFGEIVRKHQYTCYACAIMSDHVHLVIRKHRDQAENMIDYFQQESRLWLIKENAVPDWHPVWTQGGWKVFLDTPAEVWSRIRYVENNPLKEGLPKQYWPFVVPYDDWPFREKLRS
ncbi:MAG: transposase [Planctomycetes bacterium]|nr:transposase [Planctomycetota bacterium]